MIDYKVKFEVFEGPLDLLLYLIKKEEVDIYEVNLTRLATEFLEYVEVMRLLDLEIAGEFLVMAATLMYIKSRELLPREQRVVAEEEDDTDDPRWELIRKLVEYKKFKDAAAQFQLLEIQQEQRYPRLPGKPEFDVDDALADANMSIFDLVNAVSTILKRVGEREELRDVFEDRWTVSEKIDHLVTLIRTRPALKFSELFAETTSRSEVVVTFLALLELIRLRKLVATQPESFGEILITLATVPAEDRPNEEDEESSPAQAASAASDRSTLSPVESPENSPPAPEESSLSNSQSA